ncbi:MAG: hypothetical protein NVSMB49_12790 [Ktedonobacteraceae bacterium]
MIHYEKDAIRVNQKALQENILSFVNPLSCSASDQSTLESTFLVLKGIDNTLLYSYHYVERNNNIFGGLCYVFTEVGKQE